MIDYSKHDGSNHYYAENYGQQVNGDPVPVEDVRNVTFIKESVRHSIQVSSKTTMFAAVQSIFGSLPDDETVGWWGVRASDGWWIELGRPVSIYKQSELDSLFIVGQPEGSAVGFKYNGTVTSMTLTANLEMSTPVEGVVLPKRPKVWVFNNNPMEDPDYDVDEMYFKSADAIPYMNEIETKLAEAIAQRDAARTDLGAVALALGMHEESSRTTVIQGAMDCMESWAKDIQAKETAEAALATERARALQEAAGEVCGWCKQLSEPPVFRDGAWIHPDSIERSDGTTMDCSETCLAQSIRDLIQK